MSLRKGMLVSRWAASHVALPADSAGSAPWVIPPAALCGDSSLPKALRDELLVYRDPSDPVTGWSVSFVLSCYSRFRYAVGYSPLRWPQSAPEMYSEAKRLGLLTLVDPVPGCLAVTGAYDEGADTFSDARAGIYLRDSDDGRRLIIAGEVRQLSDNLLTENQTSAETDLTGFQTGLAGTQTTRATSGGYLGSAYIRSGCTAPGGGPVLLRTTGGLSGIPVSPGEIYLVGAALKLSPMASGTARIGLGFYNGSGADMGTTVLGPNETIGLSWSERSALITVPALAGFACFAMDSGSIGPGNFCDTDAMSVRAATDLVSYQFVADDDPQNGQATRYILPKSFRYPLREV